MSVWNEVILGFALVAGTYWLVKTVYYWLRFRRSIQIEIYSNFLEYSIRKKNIRRLSESYYLKSEFGKHRILYQIAQSKNAKVPQAYVILMLTSGLYILNVKNQGGKILAKKNGDFKQIYEKHEYLFRNPMEESRYFEKQLRKKMSADEIPVKSMVIFPQKCELVWEKEPADEIPVIHRKELIRWIREDFEKNQGSLTEKQINHIFEDLAEDAIAEEKAV
jgi:hypothetical protein